jgi:outer membrane lipopolysaccharide assembly protein LptE/RlpB
MWRPTVLHCCHRSGAARRRNFAGAKTLKFREFHSRPSGAAVEIFLALIVMAVTAITGCGYHVAGKAALVPSDVRTIAVPAFKNLSHQYRIEQMVTAAVKQEFVERTRFRVTSNPAEADAVLKGLITAVKENVLTFDPQTGRATTLQIQVTASVSLEDLHTHKPIYSNQNYDFREEYQISPLNPVLFEEDQPALKRLSQDLARTLVTDILEDF